jgi:hypothetical protein
LSKKGECNCDDVSVPGVKQADQAVLHNTSAGVTAIFLRRYPDAFFEDEEKVEEGAMKADDESAGVQRSMRLTLGPVECTGEGRSTIKKSIS